MQKNEAENRTPPMSTIAHDPKCSKNKRQKTRNVVREMITTYTFGDIVMAIDEDDYNVINAIWQSEAFKSSTLSNIYGRGWDVGVTKDEEGSRVCSLDFTTFNFPDGLPETVASLSALKRFSVLNTNLPTICCLRNLEELSILVSDIPEDLWNLPKLRKLILIKTKISVIPPSIGQLQNLEKLILQVNFELRSLPSSIENLKNLKELIITRCQIDELPEELWNLSGLRTLDLQSNRISVISPSIGRLHNLEILDLSDNRRIHSLPEEIGNLMNLKQLDLSGCNRISALPSSMRNLQNLQILDLSKMLGCRSVPDFLGELKQLMIFRMEDLPLPLEMKITLLNEMMKNCPFLGELDKISECSETVVHFLACNRFKFRSPCVASNRRLKSIPLRKLWPRMLSNATRAFDPYPLGSWENETSPHDAVYKLLLDGRESFLGVIHDRNSNIDSTKDDSTKEENIRSELRWRNDPANFMNDLV